MVQHRLDDVWLYLPISAMPVATVRRMSCRRQWAILPRGWSSSFFAVDDPEISAFAGTEH
jgi:hypothetical protein